MAPLPAALLLLGAAAAEATAEDREICGHGTFNITTKRCECWDGWRRAGPTDTVNFFKGRCTQFRCASSEQCAERLGISGAKCPIPGWDCYCGWEGAFSGEFGSMGLSAGYQTWGEHSAACQGPIYTLSFAISRYLLWCLQNFWQALLVAAVLMSPFGQTHVRCRCYDPGMFRLLAVVSGSRPTCDGRCTVEGSWRIYYDLAWSFYVLDVGLWIYSFLVILWLTFLVAWGILLWILVILACVVATVMAMCTACEGGGDSACPDCGNCGGSCADGPACGCCDYCGSGAGVPAGDPGLMFYTGGPFPGDTDCRCDCCTGLGKCPLCLPLAKLLLHFPRRPANMWGGFVGYVFLGTHPRSREVYSGGSWVVDLFGFRGQRDLHRETDWRRRFAAYLQAGSAQDVGRQAPAPAQQHMPQPQNYMETPSGRSQGSSFGAVRSRTFDRHSLSFSAGRRVGRVEEPFDRVLDNCRNSSYEDYENGDCWICCDSKNQPTWDLWLQCGHLFCTRCSEEMLKRKLPCPLCRQVSYNVKRGPAKYHAP